MFTINGQLHLADAASASAYTAANNLYTSLNTLYPASCTTNFVSGHDLGGTTLTPGVYCFTAGSAIIGSGEILTLNGQGSPNSQFIFIMGSSLTLNGAGSDVVLTNGTRPCGVFWVVGSSASFSGAASVMVGNVIALTSITSTLGYTFDGNLIALNAAVTLDGNTVTAVGGCANNCTPV